MDIGCGEAARLRRVSRGVGSGPDKLFRVKHCETYKYVISLVFRHVPPVTDLIQHVGDGIQRSSKDDSLKRTRANAYKRHYWWLRRRYDTLSPQPHSPISNHIGIITHFWCIYASSFQKHRKHWLTPLPALSCFFFALLGDQSYAGFRRVEAPFLRCRGLTQMQGTLCYHNAF